ncbi:Peptide-methionine (S)-S-oxide reductase MsrA [hydrothermal vent metagenome]|uniref:peptide-methionine (S)-S-oxide reductase n=1 Tax=hydrothermal vent metagenome TaxID=652676 RepID=A0A3B1BHD5_9ZZZZ
MDTATFAGGCFWCMEPPFAKLGGVAGVMPGYMGGTLTNPTYEDICTGMTGHAEVARVTFDKELVNYEKLLQTFWMNIDPTRKDGQFSDAGSQYRPVIFYHTDAQKLMAELSRMNLQDSGKFEREIVVEITEASTFYPAEEYHREYYKKNPGRYKMYRTGSGREGFLARTWDKRS